MTLTPELTSILAITLSIYVLGLYAIAFSSWKRIQDSEDFIVAARKLNFPLCTATLLATWFGAGTLLTATDEVRHGGLQRAALEPLGAGFCLIVVGLFFARPLWQMKLLTVSDFFRKVFGHQAEIISATIIVPSYFGWIAAQLVALAGILHLFFGFETTTGVLFVTLIALGYTLLGGMWSVTVTDIFQIGLVLAGLIFLGISTLTNLGGGTATIGLTRLWNNTPSEMKYPIPIESGQLLFEWFTVFAVGTLGNIPGQDLMQRVFAARSARIAARACCVAGALYILFGFIPLMLGLSARLIFPGDLNEAILPALVHALFSPASAVIFTVVLVSAVLSTIDSAILAPASILSRNVLMYLNRYGLSPLALTRIAVLIVTFASACIALSGDNAYTLLKNAYELPMVCILAPMTMSLYSKISSPQAATVSMLFGFFSWIIHYSLDWKYFLEPWATSFPFQLPASITLTLINFVVYIVVFRKTTEA